MKRIKFFLIWGFLILILVELFTRYILGLGEVPVYIESSEYEYIYSPNQNVNRFGNTIITNEYSMRSLPLSDDDEIRILKFGDSVINGGSLTDHDDLASTILEKRLSEKLGKNARVLNISAGSWGPGNAFAYLKKHGDFGAKLIVLVFSSHDLHDNMGFGKVVGKHKSWPNKQPIMAITDSYFNYFLPWVKSLMKIDNDNLNLQISQGIKENSGWKNFIEFCKSKEIPLFIYIHATREEKKKRELNENGIKIRKILQQNNVNYCTGIEFPILYDGYRDNIHLNRLGQNQLANIIENCTFSLIKNSFK